MASLYQKGGGASSTYAGLGGSYGGLAPSTTATSYGSDPSFRSSFGTDPLSLYGSSSAYGSSASSWQQMDPLFSSLKRPGDEVFYSGDALPKRTRYEMPQLFTPFPQRPGEKDCVFYMRTRTCSFGANCKFDHPAWVPAGGIPDWKEVSTNTTTTTTNTKTQSLPVREGEPDCAFYMKTGICKFGSKCKFNHPENKGATGIENESANGFVKSTLADSVAKTVIVSANGGDGDTPTGSVKPATSFNAKGLPIRLGEADCSFYLKTGSCKFGSACRFNHPASVAIQQSQTAVAPVLGGYTAAAPYGSFSLFPGALPDYSFTLPPAPADLGLSSLAPPSVYPQRPGETTCAFFMKTGVCKFAASCKYHHPIDRKEPSTKITLAGYPRREGEQACPFYMKTGTCKYALTCKFDHPPPGEAAAKALADAGKSEQPEIGEVVPNI
ncbi:hypothetical protein L7F22_068892 [Adiantum nelumboides]|nr:hypothetical protein [Adiantum nelumboides]